MAKSVVESDVIIFDGSNAAHRISAISPPLNNSKGERTEVIFGLLRLLSSVIRSNPAKQCYVVWDGKGSKRIRQCLDPEYKAHRETGRTEEDRQRITGMHQQVTRWWELFGVYLPILNLESQKYEADDIIAMLCHAQTGLSKTSLVVSGDKDLLQLVDPMVSVYSPIPDKYCRMDNFEQYTGGFPNGRAYLAAKCLMGDSSDNIKGVGGVGEKTALKILSAHDWSLEVLKLHPSDELAKTKVGQHLLTSSAWERIALNYTLMSLSGPAHECLRTQRVTVQEGEMNTKALRTNLAKMQFASLMAGFSQFIAPFNHLEK